MNLMMTLSLFSALAIGRIPAYLLAKAKQTDRKGQGEIHNFKTLISIPAWKSKPSWVAVATKDRTINPDLERWYATRAHGHKIEVVGAATRFTPRDPRRLQLSSKTLQRTRDENRLRCFAPDVSGFTCEEEKPKWTIKATTRSKRLQKYSCATRAV
jgi:hypothetical protein